MKRLKALKGSRTFVLIILLIALILLVGLLNPSKFYAMANLQSMGRQLSEIGIYALAMFTVVVSGGLNLSIVAVANFSAICGGCIMQGIYLGDIIVDPTMRLIVGLIVSLGTGVLSGLLNGYFVAGLGLTAVLVTSATSQLFQGMALVLTKGNSIVGAPEMISALGTQNMFGVVPYLLVLTIVCYAICGFIFEKTCFGAQCRLLGANSTASMYSGISNFKTLMKSYMLSGLFSAIAGLVSYSRMSALRPDYGTSLTNNAMLVVLMGGAWIVAGGGKILNIFISLFCIQVISSGLTLGGTSTYTRDTVWGLMLVGLLVFATPEMKGYLKRLFHIGGHRDLRSAEVRK